MDKMLPILLIATLIIGLASGFIFSFFVYQPQLQNLSRALTSLQNEIDARFAENERMLSDLNKTIANLNATIEKAGSTSETPENETEIPQEQLGLQAQATSNGTHFEISFDIVNSGPAPARITFIYLYAEQIQVVPDVTSIVFNGVNFSSEDSIDVPIPVGTSVSGTITLIKGSADGFNFQSGTYIEFRFISAQRYHYFVTVDLP